MVGEIGEREESLVLECFFELRAPKVNLAEVLGETGVSN